MSTITIKPEPNASKRKEWEAWVASRPEVVRVIAERFPPWKFFRHLVTDQIVSVTSFFEDGTVSMYVIPGGRELDIIGFGVFGVDPDDLEEYEPTEVEMRRMQWLFDHPAPKATVHIHDA